MPNILWVDDEIEMLKPHHLFLEERGYTVEKANNGSDALDLVKSRSFDVIFLDENMPGMSGLEVLEVVKELKPELPVVMITKSEEEQIMEMAIGSKIADYLIKPVNPNQILLALKKILSSAHLVEQSTTRSYQREFGKITMEMQGLRNWDEWAAFYKKLLSWELKMDSIDEEGLKGILANQKEEANELFGRMVERNYQKWFAHREEAHLMSDQLVESVVAPLIKEDKKVFFLVMDNLRLDQWMVMKPLLSNYANVLNEGVYGSILPSATQYARNSLFAGMMPADIAKTHPQYWVGESDEGGKNNFEGELFKAHMDSLGLGHKNTVYHKVTNIRGAKKYVDNLHQLKTADVAALVYNFVDTLSHAKTDTEVIRELARDDRAYRKLTATWFSTSPLLQVLKYVLENGWTVVLTTDHGTVNVGRATKVVGTRELTTNLRYKSGKGISYNAKHVLEVDKPEAIGLPKEHIADKFIFAVNDYFMAYPNRYNHFVQYYKNTYQHGGISLEELIIPYAVLSGK